MGRIFLSFTEEMVLNPAYAGFIGGRVEVYEQGGEYATDELRFFTNDADKFYKFRDKYDFKELNEKQYGRFKRLLTKFQWREPMEEK